MEKCNYCGAEMDDGAKFCTACGNPLHKKCKQCGCENDTAARFCKQCGAEFDEVRIDYKASEKLNIAGISNCQHLFANGNGTIFLGNQKVDFAKMFAGNDLVEEIVLPKVDVIPDHAFDGCYKLRKVTIPDTVTEIGYCAFYQCNGLMEITLPANLKIIGNCAFHRCESLTEIIFPSSMVTVGAGAFAECTGLKKITFLENDHLTIENKAFADCCDLEEVRIKGGQKIGKQAFYNCSRMNYLSVRVRDIDEFAFQGCSGLSTIFLCCFAKYIGTIADSAFCNCNMYASSELANYRGIKKFGTEFNYVRSTMLGIDLDPDLDLE